MIDLCTLARNLHCDVACFSNFPGLQVTYQATAVNGLVHMPQPDFQHSPRTGKRGVDHHTRCLSLEGNIALTFIVQLPPR